MQTGYQQTQNPQHPEYPRNFAYLNHMGYDEFEQRKVGDNAKGEQGPVFVVARKMPSLEKSTEITGLVSQKGLREGEEELELSMATLLIWKGLEKKLLKVPLDGSPRTSVEIQDAERGVGDDLWRCRGAAMGRLIQASGAMDTLQWRVVEAATGRVEYLAPSTIGVAFVDVDSGGRIWTARSEGICQVAPKNSLIPDP